MYPEPAIQRQYDAAQWITDEPLSLGELTERIRETFGVTRAVAQRDASKAIANAAANALNNQPMSAGLAMTAAMRNFIRAEQVCREHMDLDGDVDDDSVKRITQAKKVAGTYREIGTAWSALFRTLLTARPGMHLSDEQGRALLIRALEQGVGEFDETERLRIVHACNRDIH